MENPEAHFAFAEANSINWIIGGQVGVGVNFTGEGQLTSEKYIVIKLSTKQLGGEEQDFIAAGTIEGFLTFANHLLETIGGIDDY